MTDPRIDLDESRLRDELTLDKQVLANEALRDDLALDRTVLSNERTVLSYTRTALFLLVSGVSLIKLFPGNLVMAALGYLVIAVSFVVMLFGVYRYWRVRRKINTLRRSVESERPVV